MHSNDQRVALWPHLSLCYSNACKEEVLRLISDFLAVLQMTESSPGVGGL